MHTLWTEQNEKKQCHPVIGFVLFIHLASHLLIKKYVFVKKIFPEYVPVLKNRQLKTIKNTFPAVFRTYKDVEEEGVAWQNVVCGWSYVTNKMCISRYKVLVSTR